MSWYKSFAILSVLIKSFDINSINNNKDDNNNILLEE